MWKYQDSQVNSVWPAFWNVQVVYPAQHLHPAGTPSDELSRCNSFSNLSYAEFGLAQEGREAGSGVGRGGGLLNSCKDEFLVTTLPCWYYMMQFKYLIVWKCKLNK